MTENRRLARKQPDADIEIQDKRTGEVLGQLANITSEGLMLIGSSNVAPGTLFQVRMKLPSPIDNMDTIEFGIESLWSQAAGNSNRYWVGFHIIDISPRNVDAIECMSAGWEST